MQERAVLLFILLLLRGADIFGVFGCVVYPLHLMGLEPAFSVPTSLKVDEVVLANGIVTILLFKLSFTTWHAFL
jgi:hypothetical protein